jgi:hypothetical protein
MRRAALAPSTSPVPAIPLMHPSALLLPLLLAACVPAATAPPVAPATPAPGEEIERELLDVQALRFSAMVRYDLDLLDEILDAELVYTHSTGAVEGKREFIGNVLTGAIRYVEITPMEVRVQTFPGVAVITGRVWMRVIVGGREMAVTSRFTEVYALRDGGWRLVAWQSTRIPEQERGSAEEGGR